MTNNLWCDILLLLIIQKKKYFLFIDNIFKNNIQMQVRTKDVENDKMIN